MFWLVRLAWLWLLVGTIAVWWLCVGVGVGAGCHDDGLWIVGFGVELDGLI